MYHLDGLHESGALSVADVECPKGYYPGAWLPSERWRWRPVKAVLAMDDWAGETYEHTVRVPQSYVPY